MRSIYNSIPHIHEAVKHLTVLQSSVLPELKLLLAAFGLESQLGIVLVHRHFDLNGPEEQVVELKGPGTLVSSVFKNGQPDTKIIAEYNLDIPESFAVVPARFVVRDELIPYEYKCVPKDKECLYGSCMRSLPLEFLKEWCSILIKYFAEDKMGLVEMFTEETLEGFEHTDMERRLNVVRIDSERPVAKNYVSTLWVSQQFPGQPARTCVCAPAPEQRL